MRIANEVLNEYEKMLGYVLKPNDKAFDVIADLRDARAELEMLKNSPLKLADGLIYEMKALHDKYWETISKFKIPQQPIASPSLRVVEGTDEVKKDNKPC